MLLWQKLHRTLCKFSMTLNVSSDKKTLLNFESIVGQLMEQYQANLLENDKLSELRDTLLAQTIR